MRSGTVLDWIWFCLGFGSESDHQYWICFVFWSQIGSNLVLAPRMQDSFNPQMPMILSELVKFSKPDQFS